MELLLGTAILALGVGTIVAAAITGPFVNAINRRCRFVPAVDPHAAAHVSTRTA
ncbi:hypothetical protein [Bifidobacterium parmae]|uniref:hypothetical protein n=1 Tax=Bifidobacterium parmae TaxID=361854 RepID=UPI0013FE0166|nr:hypothetical protein [Bifidobacterium parmae]